MKRTKSIFSLICFLMIPASVIMGIYFIKFEHNSLLGILTMAVGPTVGAVVGGCLAPGSGQSVSAEAATLHRIDNNLRELKFMETMKQQRNVSNWKK